jgi:hypothetical protein
MQVVALSSCAKAAVETVASESASAKAVDVRMVTSPLGVLRHDAATMELGADGDIQRALTAALREFDDTSRLFRIEHQRLCAIARNES